MTEHKLLMKTLFGFPIDYCILNWEVDGWIQKVSKEETKHSYI